MHKPSTFPINIAAINLKRPIFEIKIDERISCPSSIYSSLEDLPAKSPGPIGPTFAKPTFAYCGSAGFRKDYGTARSFFFYKTLKFILVQIIFLALIVFQISTAAIESIVRYARPDEVVRHLTILFLITMVVLAYPTFRYLRLYIAHRDLTKDNSNIAQALLFSLIEIGEIKTTASQLKINSTVDKQGVIFCHMTGGSTHEQSIFITALHELTDEVDNPRYLLVRRSVLFGLFNQKDYHSVPNVFGRNKELAEIFEKNWRQKVGRCKLLFTRSIEGRKALLHARINSLASNVRREIEHQSKWL
ncbi:MAG: hypothetical protein EA409_05840 [Saprospirales bacterium]|nr:MAG: hypothetical protein EA409_05840 [Saprospirales bacterium]